MILDISIPNFFYIFHVLVKRIKESNFYLLNHHTHTAAGYSNPLFFLQKTYFLPSVKIRYFVVQMICAKPSQIVKQYKQ